MGDAADFPELTGDIATHPIAAKFGCQPNTTLFAVLRARVSC